MIDFEYKAPTHITIDGVGEIIAVERDGTSGIYIRFRITTSLNEGFPDETLQGPIPLVYDLEWLRGELVAEAVMRTHRGYESAIEDVRRHLHASSGLHVPLRFKYDDEPPPQETP